MKFIRIFSSHYRRHCWLGQMNWAHRHTPMQMPPQILCTLAQWRRCRTWCQVSDVLFTIAVKMSAKRIEKCGSRVAVFAKSSFFLSLHSHRVCGVVEIHWKNTRMNAMDVNIHLAKRIDKTTRENIFDCGFGNVDADKNSFASKQWHTVATTSLSNYHSDQRIKRTNNVRCQHKNEFNFRPV